MLIQNKKISVHLIDDHKLFVEGLYKQIAESQIIHVNGISHSIAECRKILPFHTPDILLLDISLPDGDGIEFCAEVINKYHRTKVIILSGHEEVSMIRKALQTGASGYLLKTVLSKEVIDAILTVVDGKRYLCSYVEKLLSKETPQTVWLTARERELLTLIVEGYTNKEIANKLFLGIETIKTYRKNLTFKLGAKNAASLVKMAIEQKLI